MKNVFLIIALSLVVSCASKPVENAPLSQEDKRVSRVISSTNSNIWGQYSLKNKNDLTKFDQTKYEELLTKGKSRTAEEYRHLYEEFEVKEFTIHPNTFILCGYSSKLKLAFCDDAACETTEQIIQADSQNILPELKSKITSPGVCSNAG